MTKHFDRDLVRLGERIFDLGDLIIQASDKSMVMLRNFDLILADEILEAEETIDRQEVEIEEECLKVMALHQPVASDLRFVVAVLKVNNDLERMGDQIVNIAERVRFLADKERVVADLDFQSMSEISSGMVRKALNALVHHDADEAHEVLAMDDELDALHAQTFETLQQAMFDKPSAIASATSYLTISSNLERVGDLATNIAEDIIFMEEGEVIRHR